MMNAQSPASSGQEGAHLRGDRPIPETSADALSDAPNIANAIFPTEEHPLYFLHIPKTAGTTLYNNMDDRFEVEHICPDRFLPQVLKRDPESFRRFRFFRGHFGYSLKNFVGRPLTYVTVLRDPIDRCISQFNDVRRVSNNFLYKRVNDLKMTFEDFARDAETQIAINNLQARNLVFDWSAEQMDGNFNLIRRGIAGTALGIPDDELLDIAKERLRQCAVVGLLERFQDTNALLSYRFCWYPIRPPRRLNQSAQRLQRETLDEATLDAVREKNQVDEALYRYAEQLFTEQFNQMIDDLAAHSTADGVRTPHSQEKADDPLILPALIQRYGQAKVQQSSMSPVLHLSMRHPAAGHNWHSREGLEEHCTDFRWTGPGIQSTLHVPILKPENLGQINGSVTIQIYTLRAIAPDVLQSLSLRVNESPVPLTVLTQWDSNTVFTGTIPGDAISQPPSLTCLTLTVNRTESMQAIAPHTPDQRHVGIAISRVCLFSSGTFSPEMTFLGLFPHEDDQWVAVKEFLDLHLKPQEAIAAPREFLQMFPPQFKDITTLQPLDPGLSGESTRLEWAIVAKHLVHQIPAPTFQWLMNSLQPVFSNSVFVVLSTRTDLTIVPSLVDDPWTDVAEFLSAHVQLGQGLAAPREFLFRVPAANFLGNLATPNDYSAVAESSQRLDNPTVTHSVTLALKADWVVLHKGLMDQYGDEILDRVVAEFRPVFANLVFVIFSRHVTERRLPFWYRDLRAFWKVYLHRRWFAFIRQIIQQMLQRQ